MSESIIKTKQLTKAYGEKIAVNQLDLNIEKGEIFGLLGPNGAGKTTTILMLLGLTEPTSGEAYIKGHNCTIDPISVKSIVGYMPDNVGFYSDMTGRENLRFTGRLNGLSEEEIDERVDRLLERVGMQEAADKKTGTYSRGMRQRLGIADVLMKDPEIIIMDEPTLGIDPEGLRELLALMQKLAKEDGRTLLISSHQLYQIQQICDRVGIFVEGQLIACGKIKDLAKQVQEANHYRLELQMTPCDDKVLSQIMNQPGVTNVGKEGNTFLVESDVDIRQSMTRFLGENGYTILHMHQRGGDLDEIYHLYFEKAGQSNEDDSNNETGRGFFHRRGKKKGKE
ncbi:MAG: ABC transporter ATP-binding protein [Eubacteriales bacterium]|nr:ABC transporter ATP-binding protein [Eubacteriales bacterium]